MQLWFPPSWWKSGKTPTKSDPNSSKFNQISALPYLNSVISNLILCRFTEKHFSRLYKSCFHQVSVDRCPVLHPSIAMPHAKTWLHWSCWCLQASCWAGTTGKGYTATPCQNRLKIWRHHFRSELAHGIHVCMYIYTHTIYKYTYT